MIISRVMTRNPVFIHPEMSLSDARSLMDREKIGHLPVLDRNNNLTGILARKDLIKAGPSPATTLDMYEISYLLSKLNVEKIMERNVITVGEEEVVEEAARIMVDRGIGCLPVIKPLAGGEGSLLVGIITDTDLFRVFLNAFGAWHPGIRITLSMSEKPGQLAKFAGAVAERGGNIVAFVSGEGDDLSRRRATLKISGISKADVEAAAQTVEDAVVEDLRE
ncbi:MAG: CBS domain-containing protein [Treponema sp.]|jgi:acetoin utilization protein AcuB|nr:CBS domain-containing protein [Treponema sp.]